MSKAKSVKQVLKAARWILTHLGWTQSAYFRDKEGNALVCAFIDPVDHQRRSPEVPDQLGSCCMVGAIELVETTPRLRAETIAYLSPRMSPNIGPWNDMQGRTKEEVLTVLEQAIKEAP
jgi:hypothetical protein